jgi:hypothetical protein
MVKTKQEIINDIASHFKGKVYSDCYIGITSDVDSRLFGYHKVSKENGHWIYRTASSLTVAREIEQYFLDAGMDGGGGGGDEASRRHRRIHNEHSWNNKVTDEKRNSKRTTLIKG